MGTGEQAHTRRLAPAAARLVGIDIARCLALLGMIAAHTVSSSDPGAPGGVDPLFQLVAGRSAALFAVLAGLSIALVTRRASAAGDQRSVTAYRGQVVVRAMLIALIGLVLGLVGSGVAVILTYYGVLFLAALPVLGWRARSLALLATGWGLVSPVVSMLVRPLLPEPTLVVPSPLSLLTPLQLLSELTVTGYYPVLTWCTYLFAGMAIGRADLRGTRLPRGLLLGGTLLAVTSLGVSAVVTGSASIRTRLLVDAPARADATSWSELDAALREGLLGTTPTEQWWWLLVWSPHSGTVVDLAHTTGCAMAVIGGCLWLVSVLPAVARRVLHVGFGAGTMTLTLYAVHVLVLGAAGDVASARSTLAHMVMVLVVGGLFVAVRSHGPLEILVSQSAKSVSDAMTAPRRPS